VSANKALDVMDFSGQDCVLKNKKFIIGINYKFLAFPLHSYKIADPVATRSKTWVCDHSLAGIAGSNPAGSRNVCLL
jgi:hypothetical protein